MKNIARMIVAEQLLIQIFNLPEGTRIVNIRRSDNSHYFDYEFTLQADIELIREEYGLFPIPLVTAEYITEYADCGHSNCKFVGWRLL